jgi:tagatose-6-phosphate ketose/aldose isomerase
MYLATLLCFNLDNLDETIAEVNKVIEKGQNFLDNKYELVSKIVEEYNFNRIVYLGSNSLKGFSQESALKMLELTAGDVVTMFDTPLGFRHGPKSIINDDTLTVVYLSDLPYSRQYEIDLIKEMSGQRKGNKIVAVMAKEDAEVSALVDYTVTYDFAEDMNNGFLGLAYIEFAQALAVLKSLSMNITPDNPCPTGEVNRVVKGVILYPYTRD